MKSFCSRFHVSGGRDLNECSVSEWKEHLKAAYMVEIFVTRDPSVTWLRDESSIALEAEVRSQGLFPEVDDLLTSGALAAFVMLGCCKEYIVRLRLSNVAPVELLQVLSSKQDLVSLCIVVCGEPGGAIHFKAAGCEDTAQTLDKSAALSAASLSALSFDRLTIKPEVGATLCYIPGEFISMGTSILKIVSCRTLSRVVTLRASVLEISGELVDTRDILGSVNQEQALLQTLYVTVCGPTERLLFDGPGGQLQELIRVIRFPTLISFEVNTSVWELEPEQFQYIVTGLVKMFETAVCCVAKIGYFEDMAPFVNVLKNTPMVHFEIANNVLLVTQNP